MLLLSPPWVFRSAAVTIVEVVPPYEPGLLVVEELKLQDQNYCSRPYLLLNNHQLYAGPIGVV